MESKIDKALPLGSYSSEVESWLDSEGIFDGYVYEVKTNKRVGMAGRIRHAGGRWDLVPTEIQMYFSFDDDDKLITRYVRSYTPSL